MAIQYLQETDTEWNTDFRIPCHIYVIQNTRMIGYVKEGTTNVHYFKQPMSFDKRKRKLKNLSQTSLRKMGINVDPNRGDSSVKEITVNGSKGNQYIVSIDGDKTSCTCLGYQFRGQCRHITEVLGQK